jgi:hypothetical protein
VCELNVVTVVVVWRLLHCSHDDTCRNRRLNGNAKLTGPVPASLTKLTNVPSPSFRIQSLPSVCILDAASQASFSLCGLCSTPYPECRCEWLACPSGTTNTGPVALNPVSPYYPTLPYCCSNGTGNTLRERMVTDGFLDCSTRPCTASAKGLTQVSISYINDNNITGTIPPQIAALTAATYLGLYNSNVSGTLPTQLGLMILVKEAELDGLAKLSGTIPPQISGMTSITVL